MTSTTPDAGRPGKAAPFAISAPTQVALSAERGGTTTFTVTNLTGRPLTVRLQPRATPPGSDDWYEVVGDTEVPMAVGATLSVAVEATVPADAPAGHTILTLRAVEEADPENLTDGPAVDVVVPPRPAVKPPWRPKLWQVIVAAVVLLLLAGAAVWWFLLRPRTPVNEQPPVVPDTALVRVELTGDPGTWRDEPALAFQWLRCGDPCAPIEGATALTYTPVIEDADAQLVLRVTASNDAGDTVAESNRSQVGQAPPVATTLPSLSGQPDPGRTLTLDLGTWDGDPTLTHEWQSCTAEDDPTGCAPIPGATGTSLTLDTGHTGRWIIAVVTATNPGGTTVLPTNRLGPVNVGRVAVPQVVGLTLGQAQTQFEQIGLSATVVGATTWCSPVTSQSRPAGTQVDRGTAIGLTIQYQPWCLFLDIPIWTEVNPRFLPERIGG